ncbi:MAG: hypothetical protein M3Y27_03705 [Acidobacteriota bacterium]|nr:hypothetical protein [Acidobacteriota bacterium]
MKHFLWTGMIVSCFAGAVLFAQEPELPKPETEDRAPTNASPSPRPDLFPPDILTPAERAASPAPPIPSLPTLPQLDEAFKPKPLNATIGTAQNHAEWRALNNQVANRENVRAARLLANAAATDLEKRKLLRRYYEILYSEMVALATKPELRAYLADRKKDQLNGLAQSRVRPTPTTAPSPPKPKP